MIELYLLLHTVTPHPSNHSQQAFLSRGGIWSPILFIICIAIRHISVQVLHCDKCFNMLMIQLSGIKVIPLKDDRIAAADEMSADLGRIHSWGRKWNINFEPTKCHALCVSLKKDVGFHPPVFMDTLSIAEVDVLKVLGTYFDCKLTWSYMIDQLATRSRQ